MKVIEFPRKGIEKSVTPEVTGTEQQKLHMGPVSFTCPHCASHSELHCNGMIFRAIEFHCSSCGNYFKVANPAFTKLAGGPTKKLPPTDGDLTGTKK